MKKDLKVVEVMGRRWDTSRPNFFQAPAGLSLEDIVLQSLSKAYTDKVYTKAQYRQLVRYARVRWNGTEIARENWKRVFPEPGDRIEVLHGVRGGGGGGGKNPLATILSAVIVVAAAVATSWAGGTGIFAAGGILEGMGLGLTGGALFAAQVGIGVAAMAMLYAVNMLFPAAQPRLGGGLDSGAEKQSQTYSLTGGRNSANVNGYVPLILGRHKVTPPLGAKSWTSWEGEKQFFHMLVVWGHPDIEVTNFKIGDTALDKFDDVQHNFIQSTTGTKLKYFAKQYNEESVGAVLSYKDGWVRRTVGEANDISIDISFNSGLVTINQSSGKYENRSVNFQAQYKPTSGGTWTGFPTVVQKKFDAAQLKWTEAEMMDKIDVYWVDTGKYACTLDGVAATRTVESNLLVVKRSSVVSYRNQIQIWPKPALTGFNSTSGMAFFNCQIHGTLAISDIKWNGFIGKYSSFGGTVGDFIVTLGAGSFKYNNKVHQVAASISASPANGFNPCSIYVSSSGKVQKNSGAAQLYPKKTGGTKGGNISWSHGYTTHFSIGDEEWRGAYYENVYSNDVVADVNSGSIKAEGSGEAVFTSSKQQQLVYNLRVEGLELKSYDVRIKRTTKDSEDSYIMDEATWQTMRAIIDKPAFDTPIPICVSELRIRASEQLSGYVDDFNGVCTSTFPDWDEDTQTWVSQDLDEAATAQQGKNVYIRRKTRNPASIMRYLLTSRHSLSRPFKTNRLDNDALVALWKWCRSNNYYFDYVADSEENLWARLVECLAPAQAAPTTDVDGLWGAIIDTPNKTVKQLFTPRNSWGMQIQRGFAQLPDALRVSFVDETDGWTQKEGFVYNDGYSKDGADGTKKADDVVEWSFPGVTNWKRMWKLGRYHLAQLLHRQMTVTINTDWEWIAVHRGDLVGLSSDVLMNTFGTARVARWLYRVSNKYIDDTRDDLVSEDVADLVDDAYTLVLVDKAADIPLDRNGDPLDPIGIEIDDEILFSEPSPARYGIAVRSQSNGAVSVYEVKAKYGETHSVLEFANAVKDGNKPPLGSLVSVSILGEEYEEYIVSAINPGDNLSAQITLVPWKTKEIRAAYSGAIPEYEAPVILDVVRSTGLPTPSITAVRSDESALMLTDSGAVVIRIGAYWKLPPSSTGLAYYSVQMIATNKKTGAELVGTATDSDDYVAVAGVKMKEVYYVKLRVTDPMTGRTSAWSNIVQHTVQGPVNRPPAPKNVRAQAAYPDGIRLYWDEVEVLDIHHYRPTGPNCTAKSRTKGKETEFFVNPRGISGSNTFGVYSVDVLGLESTKPGTCVFRVEPPKKPVIADVTVEIDGVRQTVKDCILKNDGIEIVYKDAKGTWPIEKYEWNCLDKTGFSSTLLCVVPHPDAFKRGDTVRGRAMDVYGNWGEWCDSCPVTVIPPETPKVEIGVNENGTAVFEWQNCRTVTDIKHYELEGASKGSTTALHVVLNVKDIIWEPVDENGNPDAAGQYRRGALTEYVTAVDKWGFESDRGGGTQYIWPPYNPVISLTAKTDGLYLEWQDCKRTFLIERYDIEDDEIDLDGNLVETTIRNVQTISQQGNSVRLKPRPGGLYRFRVQAWDVIGSESARMEYVTAIQGVQNFTPSARVDGGDVLIEWPIPVSSFPVATYRIFEPAGTGYREIGQSDTTYCRFPAPKAETSEILGAGDNSHYVRTYYVQAVDTAGNETELCRADVSIGLPVPPEVSVKLSADGVTVSWQEGASVNALPVKAWRVVRWYTATNGAAREDDYGTLDVTSVTVDAVAFGSHTFAVQPIDSAGNLGAVWGTVDFEASAPGRVSFQACTTVDNNVLLYWTEPDKIFFPIEYYLFESDLGQTEPGDEPIFAEIGRIDARFASTFETVSATYNYGITPVDIAGNRGPRTTVKMIVSQPPDYILYHDYDSLFNGTKTNFLLDGQGSMIGPFSDDTWLGNLDTAGISRESTWAFKVNSGYERWLDPAASTATYVETVDVTGDPDARIPATKVVVSYEAETLAGNPAYSCQIETSEDGVNWTVETADGWECYCSNFRFIRYTITLTGGTAKISNINTKCDVKRRTDFGRVTAYASDTVVNGVTVKANADGWVSMAATPMKTGVWVPFNVEFTDVDSLPKPNVVNHPELTAYTVFEDVLNPEGFRVFVLDQNGNRVTADVDWSAFGV